MQAAREREIFDAALALLAETGYDRLTLDAVATRANASKATLYRRWGSKAGLVVEALGCLGGPTGELDTGSVAGDLEEIARCLADPTRQPTRCNQRTGAPSPA